MLPHGFTVTFFLEKGCLVFPWHDHLVGGKIVDKVGIGLDPFGLPCTSPNVLQELDAVQWAADDSLLAKRVFLTWYEISIQHDD